MIEAFGERILVRIVEIEKKKGILIVPDEKKDFQIGQVVSIGPDSYIFEADRGDYITVGSYVYTRKFAGLLLEYDGVEYISLDPKEILAFSEELK